MSFLKHSLQMVLWRGVTILLGAATAIVLARWLGPEDRGELTLFLLWISLTAVVMQFGFPEASIYIIGAKVFPEEQVISTLFAYFSALAVVAAVAGYFILTGILGLQSEQSALITGALGTSVLLAVMRHILIAHKRFSRYSVSIVLEGAVYLAVLLALHAWGAGLTIEGALAAYAFSLIASFALLVYWQLHSGRRQVSVYHVRRAVLIQCYRYGFHLFATGLGGFGVQRINYFLLEAFAGSRAVGLFAAASSLPALFANLPQQLATVLYSHVAKAGAEEGNRLTLIVVKGLGVVCLVLLVPVFIWREPLALLLFGQEFAGIGTTMVILSAAMSLMGLTSVLVNSLAGIGQPQYGGYMTYISLVLVTVLAVLLIPAQHANGAAYAQLIAAAVALVFVASVFCRKAGVSVRSLVCLSISDVRAMLGSSRNGQVTP